MWVTPCALLRFAVSRAVERAAAWLDEETPLERARREAYAALRRKQ